MASSRFAAPRWRSAPLAGSTAKLLHGNGAMRTAACSTRRSGESASGIDMLPPAGPGTGVLARRVSAPVARSMAKVTMARASAQDT